MIFCLLCYSCVFVFLFTFHNVSAIFPGLSTDHVKVESLSSWNDTWEDRLKKNLFMNYDKFARPTQHWNTTHVNLAISLQTASVDDMSNILSVNLWSTMTWNDTKLKWNSSMYGGLTKIHVASHEIWIPDIHLLNSAVHGTEYYGDRHIVLNENGTVLLIIPVIFHAFCHLDFTYWPYEENTCGLKLASWTYNGNQVNIQLREDSKGDDHYLDNYVPTSEWTVKSMTKRRNLIYYNCCIEPYITVDFIFKLSRTADLYHYIVFVPIIPIVLLMLLTFWLRPNSEMRLIINAAVIFIIVLYLLYFGIKVPPRSDSLPLIVRFYSGCFYLASLSLIISSLLINIKKLAYYFKFPRSLRRFLMGKYGRCLGLGYLIQEIELQKMILPQELEEDSSVIISMSTTSLNNDELIQRSKSQVENLEWILLATTVDRLFFLIFCFVLTTMSVIYLHGKRSESLEKVITILPP